MRDLTALILNTISKKSYQPMSPKALARKLGLADTSYREFRAALRGLVKEGKARLGKNDAVHPAPSFPKAVGIFKRLPGGDGLVRVESAPGLPPQEYYVPDYLTHDASNGDEVQNAIRRKATRVEDGLAEVT